MQEIKCKLTLHECTTDQEITLHEDSIAIPSSFPFHTLLPFSYAELDATFVEIGAYDILGTSYRIALDLAHAQHTPGRSQYPLILVNTSMAPAKNQPPRQLTTLTLRQTDAAYTKVRIPSLQACCLRGTQVTTQDIELTLYSWLELVVFARIVERNDAQIRSGAYDSCMQTAPQRSAGRKPDEGTIWQVEQYEAGKTIEQIACEQAQLYPYLSCNHQTIQRNIMRHRVKRKREVIE